MKKINSEKSLIAAGATFLVVGSIVSIVAAGALVGIVRYLNTSQTTGPSISVSGEGKITAVPDIATISFSIMKDASRVADAQKSVTESANSVIAALKAAGIAEKDVATDSYTSYPKYEWKQDSVCKEGTVCPPGKQVLTGYEVTHSMTVKVRAIDKTGDILALLGTKNVSNISGPNFTIDDPVRLQEEARAKAIMDARSKAKVLADDLDVDLGRVMSFNEDSGGMPVPYFRAMEAKSDLAVASVPEVPTGEQDIVSHVTITYRIR